MTWKRLFIILIAMVLFSIPLCTAIAQSPPSPPCRFYGIVNLEGKPVPDGTVITAVVEGDTYTTVTPAIYGSSTYAIKIEPLPGMSYDEGTPVAFIVGDYLAEQTGTWETGGNFRLDIYALIPPPPPSPTPSPSPSPTPSPSPSPTPTPTATLAPIPTPTPTDTEAAGDAWNTVIVALCIGILVVCAMFVAYLIWKYRIRPGQPRGTRPEGPKPTGERPPDTDKAAEPLEEEAREEEVADLVAKLREEGIEAEVEEEKLEIPEAPVEAGLKWQDRLMLKMMSNKLIIRIFSIPIVMKLMMWETKVFMVVLSLFKRKKADDIQSDSEPAMRWQDRLMLKMMSNKLVIRIFSIPIVVKIMMWETKVFISLISLFKRGKGGEDRTEEQ